MDDDMQTHPSQLHFLLEEIEKATILFMATIPIKSIPHSSNLEVF